MLAELKWTKIHRRKFNEYSEFVRGAMRYIANKQIAFRSLVLRRSDIDHREFHDGDKDTAHFKFVYELLFYCHCSLLNPGDTLSVFIDERGGNYELCALMEVLNTALAVKCGFRPAPVRHVSMIDSKCSEFMQINDILLGAVGHDANLRGEKEGCRPEKIAMVKLVAKLAGLPHLCLNTPPSMTHFGVWRFRLPSKNGSRHDS